MPQQFDIAILGAGIAGSALAAILSRNGARVLLIDASSHPRFSIGESTIPAASFMWKLMAERYSVPELNSLSGYERVRKEISPACGVKKHFGFVYHTEGEEPRSDRANQIAIPNRTAYEAHLYRADIDSYVFRAAVRYGVQAHQNTRVEDLCFDEDAVTLTTTTGQQFQTRFVVDACGPGSPFARQLGLRESDPTFRTRTRSIFTHMVDVPHFDDCLREPAELGNPMPWCQGTLHHVFDGGWLWVIPFNNGDHQSYNDVVSVGLTLDLDAFPPSDLTPEDEFAQLVARFPSLERQLRNAKPVRPWVRTGRLQWSSKRMTQHRYCMLASTAGFVGPLFSRGLAHSAEAVNALSYRLLAAIREDDFSEARFAYMDELHRESLKFNDELVSCSFIAFRDYELWNAWLRVWVLSQALPEMILLTRSLEFARDRDDSALQVLERISETPLGSVFASLWAACVQVVDEFAGGTRTARSAAAAIFGMLRDFDLGPLSAGMAQVDRRYFGTPSHQDAVAAVRWILAADRSPESTTLYVDLVKALARSSVANSSVMRRVRRGPLSRLSPRSGS